MDGEKNTIEVELMVAVTDDGNWIAIGASKIPLEASMAMLQMMANELGREVVDFHCVVADI